MMRRALATFALLLALAAPVSAQYAAGGVAITGSVGQSASYSLSGLATLPAVEVQAPRENGAISSYVGPLLWPLIEQAAPIEAPDHRDHLLHVLVARGADGYAVALAIGEIDPKFEGKPVIIAYKQDGVLLPTPRLIMAGDRRPGRNVRDLVAIEVR